MQVTADIAVPPLLSGEAPIVGQWYLVPCANGIPVIGEPHVDADHFNNTPSHYHCDSRFHDRDTRHGPADCAVLSEYGPARIGRLSSDTGAEMTVEPRQCLRDTPAPWVDEHFAIATMSLYCDFGFAKSKCGVCPHKRMPILNGVCSGHRLAWLPDGEIKHKPPYTFRIRGTANVLVITERCELDIIRIEIIEDCVAPYVLDFSGIDGQVLATRTFPNQPSMQVGDHFRVAFYNHQQPTYA